MKRLFFCLLFLISANAVFAQISVAQDQQEKLLTYTPAKDYKEPEYTWGFMWDYKSDYNKKYGLDVVLPIGKVLFNITVDGVGEKPTNISDEENALQNELDKKQRENNLSTMIMESFQVWFDDTKAAIEKSDRWQEFNDIKPILNMHLEPLAKANATSIAKQYAIPLVSFHFTTQQEMHKICRAATAGACRIKNKIVLINPYTKQKTAAYVRGTLVHEIGHWYGLADQYREGAWNADEEYSTGNARVKDKTSVMSGNHSAHLACDDVDGFINLIDFTLSKTKGWSKRAKRGWASFCNGKEGYKNTYYKMAKPFKPDTKTTQAGNANNKPSSNNQTKLLNLFRSH